MGSDTCRSCMYRLFWHGSWLQTTQSQMSLFWDNTTSCCSGNITFLKSVWRVTLKRESSLPGGTALRTPGNNDSLPRLFMPDIIQRIKTTEEWWLQCHCKVSSRWRINTSKWPDQTFKILSVTPFKSWKSIWLQEWVDTVIWSSNSQQS